MTVMALVRRAVALRPFVSGTVAVILLATVVSTVANAAASLVAAHTLGPERFGAVAYFFSVLGIASLAGSLGLSTQATTEVAQRFQEHPAAAARAAASLLGARLLTSVAMLVIAVVLTPRDGIAAAAVAASVMTLLATFLLGVAQGLDRPRLVAAAQAAQATAYLGAVAAWAAVSPPRVYLALAGSQAIPLLAGAWACRGITPTVTRPRHGSVGAMTRLWRHLPSLLSRAGQVYVLTLLLAPVPALAVLTLGRAGRLLDASLVSVALALALLPTTMLAPLLAIAMYPRLCALAAPGTAGQAAAAALTGRFLAWFAVVGIAAGCLLAAYPLLCLSVLYPASYADAAPMLAALSGAAWLTVPGSVLVWGLMAIGRRAAALAGAGLQLFVVALAAGAALWRADLPLWWLGLGHSAAAAVALAPWGIAMRRALPDVRWRPLRLAVAAAGCAAAMAVSRRVMADGIAPPMGALLRVGSVAVLAAVTAGALALAPARLPARPARSGALRAALVALPLLGLRSVPRTVVAAPTERCSIAGADVLGGVDVVRLRCEMDTLPPATVYVAGLPPGADPLARDAGLWLVDATHDGRINLAISFSRQDGALQARLFHDVDGDRTVAYRAGGGRVEVTESAAPAVTIRTSDGRWASDAGPSFNLRIDVDGPIPAVFGADGAPGSDFVRRFQVDGRPDTTILIDGQDGSPRHDVRQSYFDVPASAGLPRTQVTADEGGVAFPFQAGSILPYLGDTPYGMVLPYGARPAPVQVSWQTSSITAIGEVVPSRATGDGWFAYSLRRIEHEPAMADFENPFAFYDLADARDGYPDLAIRQEYYTPGDPYFLDGRAPTPLQQIRFSWDQDHDHRWDYKLDLLGRHPATDLVAAGPLRLLSIAYRRLPQWVATSNWDVATLVAAQPGATGSEGIYDWPVDLVQLRDRYITGLADTPPLERVTLAAGLRGEYALDLGGSPRLYVGPIDGQLHLAGAREGWWSPDDISQLHYRSLDGHAIDEWQTLGASPATLRWLDDQLVLEDSAGLRFKTVGAATSLATQLLPTTAEEVGALSQRVTARQLPPIAPGAPAARLRQWFEQSGGPEALVPGASLSDVRTTERGFHATLTLVTGAPGGPGWLLGRPPGSYALTYQRERGYEVQEAETMAPRVTSLRWTADVERDGTRSLPAPEIPVELRATVANPSSADAVAIPVTFFAGMEGGPLAPAGTVTVNVAGGGESLASLRWTPRAAGTWQVEARVGGGQVLAQPPIGAADVRLVVQRSGGPAGVIRLQGRSWPFVLSILVLLCATVALAAGLTAHLRQAHPR